MAELITTTKGLMDPDELEKREGGHENDNEICSWVEYWDEGELVHRSVNMHLKTAIFAEGIQANFGG
jgi:hypothetical protein